MNHDLIAKATPLMQQYFTIKHSFPDALLFFQVGDFYELFFDDAIRASAFLALTLTKRGKNNGEDIPLCGVPVHTLNHYLKKLVAGGFNVAICDQLEPPKPGTVVKRGVTRVLTPGTLVEEGMLDEKSACYLLALFPSQTSWGLLFTELLTAQLFATQVPAQAFDYVEAELIRFFPDEIILPASGKQTPDIAHYLKQKGYCTTLTDAPQDSYGPAISTAWLHTQFNEQVQKQVSNNAALGGSMDLLYTYLKKNQESALSQFKTVHFYQPQDYLILDPATQRNLDITQHASTGQRKHSLLGIMDQAQTPMGSRTIKKWLLRPLVNLDNITARQQVVGALVERIDVQQRCYTLFRQIADLERIIGRIALRRTTVRDFLALKDSLLLLPELHDIFSTLTHLPLVRALLDHCGTFEDLVSLLTASLNDDSLRSDIIKQGFDEELDRIRHLVTNGQEAILALEQQERQRTGISSLKISYTGISGYAIEVTKPNLALVPDDYHHQQTMTNRTRFTTPALQDLEREIAQAGQQVSIREQQLFQQIMQTVEQQITGLRRTAQALAQADALYGLAAVAYHNNYVKPTFNETGDIVIVGGRHPVIEAACQQGFTPNDTHLTDEASLFIITGPNMGGKSTYLRQVALICLLAQCGSFVPAKQAKLALLDRIFTRIGSGDNLAAGKSTFLIEMEETATICHQATKNSLVILDEVGRGTSTSDGLALAQAIVEYLVTEIKAKCLFATHYHELTALAEQLPMIKNYYMTCTKRDTTILFHHTIAPGVANQSFGLDVAQLAQLPLPIVDRAREILITLTHHTLPTWQPEKPLKTDNLLQTGCSSPQAHALMQHISKLDITNLSPRDALLILWDLVEKVEKNR